METRRTFHFSMFKGWWAFRYIHWVSTLAWVFAGYHGALLALLISRCAQKCWFLWRNGFKVVALSHRWPPFVMTPPKDIEHFCRFKLSLLQKGVFGFTTQFLWSSFSASCFFFILFPYCCSGLSSSFSFANSFKGCSVLLSELSLPLIHCQWIITQTEGAVDLSIGLRKPQMQAFPWGTANKAFELKRVL